MIMKKKQNEKRSRRNCERRGIRIFVLQPDMTNTIS